jgi:hypothetical protein
MRRLRELSSDLMVAAGAAIVLFSLAQATGYNHCAAKGLVTGVDSQRGWV